MDDELKTYPECVELISDADVPIEKYGARANAIVNLLKADLFQLRNFFASIILNLYCFRNKI